MRLYTFVSSINSSLSRFNKWALFLNLLLFSDRHLTASCWYGPTTYFISEKTCPALYEEYTASGGLYNSIACFNYSLSLSSSLIDDRFVYFLSCNAMITTTIYKKQNPGALFLTSRITFFVLLCYCCPFLENTHETNNRHTTHTHKVLNASNKKWANTIFMDNGLTYYQTYSSLKK